KSSSTINASVFESESESEANIFLQLLFVYYSPSGFIHFRLCGLMVIYALFFGVLRYSRFSSTWLLSDTHLLARFCVVRAERAAAGVYWRWRVSACEH